jgi:hypothetical protein
MKDPFAITFLNLKPRGGGPVCCLPVTLKKIPLLGCDLPEMLVEFWPLK